MPTTPPAAVAVHVLPNAPKLEVILKGTALVRVHLLTNGAVWFGPAPRTPPGSRFDAPAGQFRTLYAAQALRGAFVETVLHRNNRILSKAIIDLRGWTELQLSRDLQVAKLHGEGLSWHGTDARLTSDTDYTHARLVAAAIHAASTEVDGLAYRSSHNNGEICYALFDRVLPTELTALGPAKKFSCHPTIVDELISEHGAVLDRSNPIPPPHARSPGRPS